MSKLVYEIRSSTDKLIEQLNEVDLARFNNAFKAFQKGVRATPVRAHAEGGRLPCAVMHASFGCRCRVDSSARQYYSKFHPTPSLLPYQWSERSPRPLLHR